MKKLFDELNNQIVTAIVTGNYDVIDSSDHRHTMIEVDGIKVNLWTGKECQHFCTFVSSDNDICLTFSDEEKKMLHKRFKFNHEQTQSSQAERIEYERLKAKFETK